MSRKELKLQFDPDQEHQLLAIEQTTKLFDGLAPQDTSFVLGEDVVANLPEGEYLERGWLEDNLRAVVDDLNERTRGRLPIPKRLQFEEDYPLDIGPDNNYPHAFPRYTIEMETGTGKTYVYLRTIHELRKQYGFRKFVIIVPSRAIYEGTAKSFVATREHFKALYDNEVVTLTKYSSDQISKLRGFASSTTTEILVMTIDAFRRASNKIYKPTEKLPGEKLPFEYIAATRPILILDESQNYLTKSARTALLTLRPLFALNYSATPVEKPNLIYRLTPADAFARGLVKRIEVLGISESQTANDNQLSFSFADPRPGTPLAVEAELNAIEKGQAVRRRIKLKKDDDLFQKTKNPAFEGYVIEDIDLIKGILYFKNGEELLLNDPGATSMTRRDRFRVQIEETIRLHMRKQRELIEAGKSIKVLSLFFIDRVANYVPAEGLIKQLFDEAFDRLKKQYGFYAGYRAEQVREGYFAAKRKKSQVEYVDTAIETSDKKAADRKAEKEAYELIMKDKERLLSFDEPVSFIFAHSALKEGWDNPNVFQICTLNETQSERKKRQEIGRGLRLPVDQQGVRDFDTSSNVLTVVANQSYESYAAQLQQEYVEAGDVPPPRPSDAARTPARRRDAVFNSAAFRAFWNKLMRGTDYEIHVDSAEIVRRAVEKLNNTQLPEPKLTITRGRFVMTTYELTFVETQVKMAKLRIVKTDTERGKPDTMELWVQPGDKLDKRDPILKGYNIVDLDEAGADSTLTFADKGKLKLGETTSFSTQKGREAAPEREVALTERTYPIPDFIRRAADATHLTRRTLVRILAGIQPEKRDRIERNPEGFSSLFVATVREILADHIAANVEYRLGSGKQDERDIEIYFPSTVKTPQKELIPGSEASLYDKVQYDSEVEQKFVRWKLNEDPQIVCFFKFPPKFRIGLPRLIGNYNPDWAIIREDDQGLKMELVRETKGTANIENLQFKNEARKIACAKKHFAELGIDYRVVTGEETTWYLPG